MLFLLVPVFLSCRNNFFITLTAFIELSNILWNSDTRDACKTDMEMLLFSDYNCHQGRDIFDKRLRYGKARSSISYRLS